MTVIAAVAEETPAAVNVERLPVRSPLNIFATVPAAAACVEPVTVKVPEPLSIVVEETSNIATPAASVTTVADRPPPVKRPAAPVTAPESETPGTTLPQISLTVADT